MIRGVRASRACRVDAAIIFPPLRAALLAPFSLILRQMSLCANRASPVTIWPVRSRLQGRGTSPHQISHTFATQLVRRGVDVRTVQEQPGHSDLKTSAKYLHSDMRTKTAAVEKLADILR